MVIRDHASIYGNHQPVELPTAHAATGYLPDHDRVEAMIKGSKEPVYTEMNSKGWKPLMVGFCFFYAVIKDQ